MLDETVARARAGAMRIDGEFAQAEAWEEVADSLAALSRDGRRLLRLSELMAEKGEITLRSDRWQEGTAATVMDRAGWCLLGSDPMPSAHLALCAALDEAAPPAPEGTDGNK